MPQECAGGDGPTWITTQRSSGILPPRPAMLFVIRSFGARRLPMTGSLLRMRRSMGRPARRTWLRFRFRRTTCCLEFAACDEFGHGSPSCSAFAGAQVAGAVSMVDGRIGEPSKRRTGARMAKPDLVALWEEHCRREFETRECERHHGHNGTGALCQPHPDDDRWSGV